MRKRRKRRKQYLKLAPSFEKGTEADEERMRKRRRKRRKQYLKFAPSFEKGTEADEERMEKKDSRSLRKEKRRR